MSRRRTSSEDRDRRAVRAFYAAWTALHEAPPPDGFPEPAALPEATERFVREADPVQLVSLLVAVLERLGERD